MAETYNSNSGTAIEVCCFLTSIQAKKNAPKNNLLSLKSIYTIIQVSQYWIGTHVTTQLLIYWRLDAHWYNTASHILETGCSLIQHSFSFTGDWMLTDSTQLLSYWTQINGSLLLFWTTILLLSWHTKWCISLLFSFLCTWNLGELTDQLLFTISLLAVRTCSCFFHSTNV